MVKPPWSIEQQQQAFALLRLVRQMRQWQCAWFRENRRGDLIRAKRAEKDVDSCLDSFTQVMFDLPPELQDASSL